MVMILKPCLSWNLASSMRLDEEGQWRYMKALLWKYLSQCKCDLIVYQIENKERYTLPSILYFIDFVNVFNISFYYVIEWIGYNYYWCKKMGTLHYYP